MRIHQRCWVFERLKDANKIHEDLINVNCYYCHQSLDFWYTNLLEKLKEFLPENFKPTCCGCAFVNAVGIKECPLCGGKITTGWNGVRPTYPIIYCSKCGNWRIVFTRETVTELMKNYFKNLW